MPVTERIQEPGAYYNVGVRGARLAHFGRTRERAIENYVGFVAAGLSTPRISDEVVTIASR